MAVPPPRTKAPRTAGPLLSLAARLAELPLSHSALARTMLKATGILGMRRIRCDEELPVPPGPSAPAPMEPREEPAAGPAALPALEALAPPPSSPFESAFHLASAYRDRSVTPLEVAERFLEHARASERLDPPLRLFIALHPDDILAQARESTERLRRGEPLSPLDGVPVAVKDELDQRGYPTTVGTSFLGREPSPTDAAAVAALRRAGAVLLGKTNMHEIGIGVTGVNPHHGAVRNPYAPARVPGGSSSGSAACVAAGLCPLAVGADGGGSIRIPSSFCGVVGLKPTFGRISERGAAQLCWSVAHVGPIGATVSDVALGFALMASAELDQAAAHPAPPVDLRRIGDGDLRGIRVGVHPDWFECADETVVDRCRRALGLLEGAGATIVETRAVPLEDLRLSRAIHVATIVSEMATAHLHHYEEHGADYSDEVRFNLALARSISALDYLHAQRLRARLRRAFDRLFTDVHAFATPTTACTAPRLREDALRTGESDVETLERIMRFAVVANLTGHPAITVPAGFDGSDLPVGFQLMGRPFEDDFLLRLASVVERGTERRVPAIHYALLLAPPRK